MNRDLFASMLSSLYVEVSPVNNKSRGAVRDRESEYTTMLDVACSLVNRRATVIIMSIKRKTLSKSFNYEF